MRYTVIWYPAALNKLAELWSDASDQAAVAKASDEIDRQLAIDAHLKGESRDEDGNRILIQPPLGVIFSVSPDDRTATVQLVWRLSQ